MRCTSLVLLAATTLGVSQAFMTTSLPVPTVRATTSLFSDDAVDDAEAPSPSWPAFEPSGLSVADVKNMVKRMTKDNFQESLDTLQPYLVNEAGQTFYNKIMRRLAFQAKDLGLEMPAEFAKQAKWNQARRARQDAFIQGKEEERLAAEAEAAEAQAAAVEEAAAAEEESTVEEPEVVEA